MAIKGVIYSKQTVAAADHGALFAKLIPDGVISGCGVSAALNKLTISAGTFMNAGRMVHIIGSEVIEIPSNIKNKYARVKGVNDMSKPATKTIFEQFRFVIEYANTSSGFPELVKDDINNGGQIYELEWVTLHVNGAGIIDSYTSTIPRSRAGIVSDITQADLLYSVGDGSQYASSGNNWEMAFLKSGTFTLKKGIASADVFIVNAGDSGKRALAETTGDSSGGDGGDGGKWTAFYNVTIPAGVYNIKIGTSSSKNTTFGNLFSVLQDGQRGAGGTAAETGYDGNVSATVGSTGVYAWNDANTLTFPGRRYSSGGNGGGAYSPVSGETKPGATGNNNGGNGGQSQESPNGQNGATNTGSGGGGAFGWVTRSFSSSGQTSGSDSGSSSGDSGSGDSGSGSYDPWTGTYHNNAGTFGGITSRHSGTPGNGGSGIILIRSTMSTTSEDDDPISADIRTAVAEWLDENLDPEGETVIDPTLSVSGAAADAKVVGDKLYNNRSKSDVALRVRGNYSTLSSSIFNILDIPNDCFTCASASKWKDSVPVEELRSLIGTGVYWISHVNSRDDGAGIDRFEIVSNDGKEQYTLYKLANSAVWNYENNSLSTLVAVNQGLANAGRIMQVDLLGDVAAMPISTILDEYLTDRYKAAKASAVGNILFNGRSRSAVSLRVRGNYSTISSDTFSILDIPNDCFTCASSSKWIDSIPVNELKTSIVSGTYWIHHITSRDDGTGVERFDFLSNNGYHYVLYKASNSNTWSYVDISPINTPAVDSTLSQSGAAADAEATGTAINAISDELYNGRSRLSTSLRVPGHYPTLSLNTFSIFNIPNDGFTCASSSKWIDSIPEDDFKPLFASDVYWIHHIISRDDGTGVERFDFLSNNGFHHYVMYKENNTNELATWNFTDISSDRIPLVDSTLSVSGAAADAAVTGSAINSKLNGNMGSSNAGKIMMVANDGLVGPAAVSAIKDALTVQSNIESSSGATDFRDALDRPGIYYKFGGTVTGGVNSDAARIIMFRNPDNEYGKFIVWVDCVTGDIYTCVYRGPSTGTWTPWMKISAQSV